MEILSRVIKNPIARKRLKRLKEMKRAYISLWIITILYITSFGAELICNDTPLYVKYQNRSYFPVLTFYPDDTFTGSGKQTRPDYHRINNSPGFKQNPKNYMVFPPIAFGPYASIDPDSIEVADVVSVRFVPQPMIGTVNVRQDFTIARAASFGPFIGRTDKEAKNQRLTDYFDLPDIIHQAIGVRFKNANAPAVSAEVQTADRQKLVISLSTYSERKRPPKSVRLTFKEKIARGSPGDDQSYAIEFDRELNRTSSLPEKSGEDLWAKLAADDQKKIWNMFKAGFWVPWTI